MYERGKVVFRATPSKPPSPSAETVDAGLPETTGTSDSPAAGAAPDHTALPETKGYVLTRVVPKYPEEARQQGVHGPVVLNALVGTDGSVRAVRVISGDPQLVQAALDAVRQWRFLPHRLNGKPDEFETSITVNFLRP